MILSIGDLVLDITIVPEGPLRPDDDRPARIDRGGGGQAANFCAWSAALGEPVRLVTRVGDDESGRQLVAELEARGVEVRPVWAAEPTGAIAVLVAPDGQRAMATQRGASVGLSPDDLLEAWFTAASLVHIHWLLNPCDLPRTHSATTWLRVGAGNWVRPVTVLDCRWKRQPSRSSSSFSPTTFDPGATSTRSESNSWKKRDSST